MTRAGKDRKLVAEDAVATEQNKIYRLPYLDECELMPVFS
jgi:hypothetical protein